MSLGNYRWSSDDGDVIAVVETDEEGITDYTVTTENDGVYRIRVFTESQAASVFHEGNDLDGTLASLDCRDTLGAYEDFDALDHQDLSCDIQWFDYGLRDYDGGMGAPMALDYFDAENGYSEIDESYINVWIELEDSGWDVTLGGYGFDATDGDAITFQEEMVDEDLGAQLTWTIAGDGWDDPSRSGFGVTPARA